MKKCKWVLLVSLRFLLGCTSAQPPPPKVEATPLVTPITSYNAARGCDGEHDRIYIPGVYIDAYPSLPPKADPDHIILHLSDGTTIWAKPHYGSEDCRNYINCRRATLVLNPAWNQCSPQGIFYEVTAEDGKLVFEANSWEITDRATNNSVHVGFACGRGFAAPDLTAVSNQTDERACLSQSAAANSTGRTMAAALALGAAYFNYRAAYNRAVQCVTDESSGTRWSPQCY